MKRKKSKIVILTGAGISAESGLGTFRDKGGLWDDHDINDVATPEAWERNAELVLEFYNMRRELVVQAEPNEAHQALVRLEKHFHVQIITQNIDDLHERAGSSNVLHLHGEILYAQSVNDPNAVIKLKKDYIKMGDCAPDGGQLRPHVVWFGEPVPKMIEAEGMMEDITKFIVIGTSLNVYPAANLIYTCPPEIDKYLVDLNDLPSSKQKNLIHLKGKATDKVPELVEQLIAEASS